MARLRTGRQHWTGLAAGLIAIASAAMFPAEASAQSALCDNLKAQIDRAPQTAGVRMSAQAAKYAAAAKAQEGQISKARAQMRALGCGSGSVQTVGGRNGPACAKLSAAMKAMTSNLGKLKSQASAFSSARGASQRDILIAKYRRAGCADGGGTNYNYLTRKNDSKDGISAVYGNTERKRPTITNKVPGLGYRGETFRTLCVRKCDGYYFPISFSTTVENMYRDEQACSSLCPGTEVQLFVHKVPEEESEDMVTLDGAPYRDMSYAFAYRRDGPSSDPACQCRGIQGTAMLGMGVSGQSGIAATIGGSKPENGEADAEASVPLPASRPDGEVDAETTADRAGGLDDGQIKGLLHPEAAASAPEGDVRVVGPVFLPDPAEALPLKARAQPIFQ